MARPAKFDREQVLEKMMLIFWERGYACTSLSDILAATGLKKGSLYHSFGNKEKLFRLALSRYSVRGPAFMGKPGPSLDSLVFIYSKLVDDAAVPELRRRACLVFNSGLEFGTARGPMARAVRGELGKLENFFRAIIGRAVAAGDLPRDLDQPAAAARIFSAAFTLREIARFRPERRFLLEIANAALASLGTKRRIK